MEPSPLTQQARPQVFQPKIVELYDNLFKEEDDEEKSEGFWREFFLLKPDKPSLENTINELSAEDLLHLQTETRHLFARAITHIKAGTSPADGNALDTLTSFFSAVLTKKYNNPSSDIINVLAGLDEVDAKFTDFVATLDVAIRSGRTLDVRRKAIETTLAITSGAYQTSLLSYFTHRDLFPSLIKFIQDSQHPSQAFEPFTLLGLLANYNKFEFQNPYRLRLNDFVNEGIIQKIIRSIGSTCANATMKYVDIQEDMPEGWTLSSTLGMFGLASFAPGAKDKPPALDPEVAKAMFAKLPDPSATILLATYDFAHANKVFCFNLVSLPADPPNTPPPIASFITYTSYILQHAHQSARTGFYARLNLLTLRFLAEDPTLCKRLCSDSPKQPIRLCRQRPPFLPYTRTDRTLCASILDLLIDGLTHNLRKRLDVDLYILNLSIIHRLIAHLSQTRTRLNYHFSELFKSLTSLIRFLTTYTTDLKSLNNIERLLDTLVNLLALSLSHGEQFLPTAAAYDDLFYKLIECSDVLVKFRDNYDLGKRENGIETLISVVGHYKELLGEGKGKTLTSKEVSGVIKGGYETLNINSKEGLDKWEGYREVDEKGFFKKVARCVVGDVRGLVATINVV